LIAGLRFRGRLRFGCLWLASAHAPTVHRPDMRPEMPAGSLEPMRPDPGVRGPDPSSLPPRPRRGDPIRNALLAGPPLPLGSPWRSRGSGPWISKSLGRPSGRMSRQGRFTRT
jgi:hypothetical protein